MHSFAAKRDHKKTIKLSIDAEKKFYFDSCLRLLHKG